VVDRGDERLALDRERRPRRLRQVREVLGPLGVQRVLARAALDAHGAGAGRLLDGDIGLRQCPHDLEQEPAGEHGRAGLVHLRRDGDAHRKLHVSGGELDRAVGLSAQKDAGEDLDGRSLGDASRCDLQAAEQVILGTDDFHALTLTSRCYGL
jgi:hypothetical protein